MGKISLLDCTLRDGGNVNNCRFGRETIRGLINGLIDSGVNIIEIGFLRDEPYDPDRSVYAHSSEIRSVLDDIKDRHRVKIAAMVESKESLEKTFPLEKVARLQDAGLDLLRITAWERLFEEHLAYCKAVKDMGIAISIQPTAVAEYTDERFAALLDMVNEIRPYSFYLVDTWGTELPGKIRHLAEMADRVLSPDIILGYHGHNNRMQAMACMEAVLGLHPSRELLCDGSLGGMGKGPGNMQTEVAADLLNEEQGGNYDVDKLCALYACYIKRFLEEDEWGYSMYHFIGSKNIVTQNYASYFKEMGYGEDVFYRFVKSLSAREKGYFNKEFTEKRLKELGLK